MSEQRRQDSCTTPSPNLNQTDTVYTALRVRQYSLSHAWSAASFRRSIAVCQGSLCGRGSGRPQALSATKRSRANNDVCRAPMHGKTYLYKGAAVDTVIYYNNYITGAALWPRSPMWCARTPLTGHGRSLDPPAQYTRRHGRRMAPACCAAIAGVVIVGVRSRPGTRALPLTISLRGPEPHSRIWSTSAATLGSRQQRSRLYLRPVRALSCRHTIHLQAFADISVPTV